MHLHAYASHIYGQGILLLFKLIVAVLHILQKAMEFNVVTSRTACNSNVFSLWHMHAYFLLPRLLLSSEPFRQSIVSSRVPFLTSGWGGGGFISVMRQIQFVKGLEFVRAGVGIFGYCHFFHFLCNKLMFTAMTTLCTEW